MPLLRLPTAFDHPDCLFELKHDGFRPASRQVPYGAMTRRSSLFRA
jgi:hypothetical protein